MHISVPLQTGAHTDMPTQCHITVFKLAQDSNLYFLMYISDLRRFRTYKGNSVRDLLRAMRNKVSLRAYATSFFIQADTPDTFSLCLTFCILHVTEASLSRVATRGAGDPRWTARRLRQLLHLTFSTVTDAHTCCSANLCPRKTVSPLLSAPQHQTTLIRICTSYSVHIYTHTHTLWYLLWAKEIPDSDLLLLL